MSRPVASSDLHLGHNGIVKYRTQFSSVEEHDEYVLKRHKDTIKKNDTWFCMGDVAFTKAALMRIKEIVCRRKVLILGNHEFDGDITMEDLLEVFDAVYSLKKHSAFGAKMWFSHCPIHPGEFRSKDLNVHGHQHDKVVEDDLRYVNVCVEHTDYGVVPLEDLVRTRTAAIELQQQLEERDKECLSKMSLLQQAKQTAARVSRVFGMLTGIVKKILKIS